MTVDQTATGKRTQIEVSSLEFAIITYGWQNSYYKRHWAICELHVVIYVNFPKQMVIHTRYIIQRQVYAMFLNTTGEPFIIYRNIRSEIRTQTIGIVFAILSKNIAIYQCY